jgi:segregation and condensation protein A
MPATAAQATAEAARRLVALDALARMRAAASWLSARPQLGHEVFPSGRGEHTPSPQAALYVAFLEATLVMLEGRDGQGSEAPPVYRPAVSDLWRTPDAIARVERLLATDGESRPLAGFLPEILAEASHRALRRRAAAASTLMAGLELARPGMLAAGQCQPFGPIMFAAAGPQPRPGQHAAR